MESDLYCVIYGKAKEKEKCTNAMATTIRYVICVA